MLESVNIGNVLNRTVNSAKSNLFSQGELAQLTFEAFNVAKHTIRQGDRDEIIINYPVGYGADKQTIAGTRKYNRDDLVRQYDFLTSHILPLNGIVQLVTIIEAVLMDIVRLVVLKYPKKLGGKRHVPLETVLQASTLDEIQIRATDALINELSYEAPSAFADAMQKLLSIDLQACPAFHKYIEIKATRDIYIHARGTANDVYVKKAANLARVKAGQLLPIDLVYFLESYECCLQLTEWLEEELHQLWHSDEMEARKKIPEPSNAPVQPSLPEQLGPASPAPPVPIESPKKSARKRGKTP